MLKCEGGILSFENIKKNIHSGKNENFKKLESISFSINFFSPSSNSLFLEVDRGGAGEKKILKEWWIERIYTN